MFPSFDKIKKDARAELKDVWVRTGLKEVLLFLLSPFSPLVYFFEFAFLIYVICFPGAMSDGLLSIRTGLIWGLSIHLGFTVLTQGLYHGARINMNHYYYELVKKPKDAPKTKYNEHFKYSALHFFTNLFKHFQVALLSCFFVAPGIITSIKYSMSSYIISFERDLTPREALVESEILIDCYKMTYFKLMISFIPMILCSILTLGIGFIWSVPYIKACQMQFYYYLTHPEFFVQVDSDELESLKKEKFSFDEFILEYEEKVENKRK